MAPTFGQDMAAEILTHHPTAAKRLQSSESSMHVHGMQVRELTPIEQLHLHGQHGFGTNIFRPELGKRECHRYELSWGVKCSRWLAAPAFEPQVGHLDLLAPENGHGRS